LRDAELKAADPNYEFSDVANARLLLDRHGHRLRYCPDWGTWLVWDNRRWARDATGQVERLAKQALDEALLDAALDADAKTRERRTREIVKCMRDHRIRAMVALAATEDEVPIRASELDADPWLLNVLNGTIDLRRGELREHRQSDLITKLAPVEYDPAAECPRFIAFLDRIFAGNRTLISFVQRGLGYALTGSTREQVLFVFYGVGANGKTTLVIAMLNVLGDYATQAAPNVLLARRWDDQPGDHAAVAALVGARFVAAVEVENGRRLAESLVKQLTGRDRVKAKFMRENWFEFDPQFKLFLACNHRPVIKGTDGAIWRRIRLVPFNVVIPEQDQDKDLPEKLRAEAPGILRWLVDGCLGWQISGLGEPEEVTGATEAYRRDMDVLGTFLDAECLQGPAFSVSKKALYSAFAEWSIKNGEETMPQRVLSHCLQERGFESRKDGPGRRGHWWLGLGLRNDLLAEEAPSCDAATFSDADTG
jgi:putative DNA primase/helicase